MHRSNTWLFGGIASGLTAISLYTLAVKLYRKLAPNNLKEEIQENEESQNLLNLLYSIAEDQAKKGNKLNFMY